MGKGACISSCISEPMPWHAILFPSHRYDLNLQTPTYLPLPNPSFSSIIPITLIHWLDLLSCASTLDPISTQPSQPQLAVQHPTPLFPLLPQHPALSAAPNADFRPVSHSPNSSSAPASSHSTAPSYALPPPSPASRRGRSECLRARNSSGIEVSRGRDRYGI